MADSVLNGKKILAVDDEQDVLRLLEAEIVDACPDCVVETAATFETAAELLENRAYDIVILDIMGVRGFDLLDIAVKKNLKVAMLTAHAVSLEALKRSYDMKARSYLPKDMLGEIVPFLEDILRYDYQTGWEKLAKKLPGFFTDSFESDWEKKTGKPWRAFRP